MTHFNGYEYTSARSAQVLPPKPEAKPEPYRQRVEAMRAAGVPPHEILGRIELVDNHRGKLPTNQVMINAAARNDTLRARILERMTADWQTYHAFADLASRRGSLHAELSRMATDGKIECISGKGRGCATYRKIQGVGK